ncbi:MAG TPA: hypothetical protein VEX88_04560 [Glaciibacter sp.]|nr:hypothetical protein [Glaciibacter sp.]
MSLTPDENRRRSVAVWMFTIGSFAVVQAGFSIVTAFVTGDFLRWLIVAGALTLVGLPLRVVGKRRKREFDY